ncbi:MAG: glycoside hydrolase family 13 protein [Clostridia bacterium]|nr:glycoside hydrolase family 13 protein [Clostridia bacterium]
MKSSLRLGACDFRAEYSYCHEKKKNKRTAFPLDGSGALEIKLPRSAGVCEMSLEIYCESLSERRFLASSLYRREEGAFEIYRFSLPISTLGAGLYFVRLRAKAFGEDFYSHREGEGLYFDRNRELSSCLQLTVYDYKSERAEEILGGVIYHVFCDRFARGGKTELPEGRRLISGEWSEIAEYPEYRGAPLKNNTFYGGTLYGVADRLDYIASLGATAIYLSPIFTSASNHRYDTADYMSVDPLLGGDEALSHLIKEAEKRNIKIILDGVFNHTGADSIYFNRYSHYDTLGAYQSKESRYYPWYDFQSHPNKYTSWWGIEILPRINPDKPECGDYFVGEGGVIAKYSQMGVYGFRLDVADELSDAFIEKIKARLNLCGENVLYGEVWEDASNKISYNKRKKYYLGTELDGVMNYPLREGLIDYVLHRSTDKLRYALTDVTDNAPDRVMHTQMNLLGTHDTERILTVLSGEDVSGLTNAQLAKKRLSPEMRALAKRRLTAAVTVLMTLPGIPAVFYGDEVGLEGYHDPFNRMPYPYGYEDGELLSHYRRLGALRRQNSVYRDGEFLLDELNDSYLVFTRSEGKKKYITVLNNSDNPIEVSANKRTRALLSGEYSRTHSLNPTEAEVFLTHGRGELEIKFRGKNQ